MRATVIAPNAWTADNLRWEAARGGKIGLRVWPIEFVVVARLAGRFLAPIDRIALLDAVREALELDCPP